MTEHSPNDPFHASSFLQGQNADYVEQLYARFATDPAAVDASWAAFFRSLGDSETVQNRSPRSRRPTDNSPSPTAS